MVAERRAVRTRSASPREAPGRRPLRLPAGTGVECDGKQIRVPGEVCEHDGRAQIEVAAPLRSRSWSTTRNPNAWRPGRRRSVKGA